MATLIDERRVKGHLRLHRGHAPSVPSPAGACVGRRRGSLCRRAPWRSAYAAAVPASLPLHAGRCRHRAGGGKEHRVSSKAGRTWEHALTADYAFVRVGRPTSSATFVFRSRSAISTGSWPRPPTHDRRSRRDRAGGLTRPRRDHTPGIWVQRIVKIGDGDVLHLKPRLRDDA